MKNSVRWILRGTLGSAALFLMIFGLVQGGYQDVMNKAIRVCLECIGIG